MSEWIAANAEVKTNIALDRHWHAWRKSCRSVILVFGCKLAAKPACVALRLS
jgi:hypothetical protein